MKTKHLSAIVLVFCLLSAKAQTGATDTGFAVRIISFSWMPDGEKLAFSAMKFYNDHKQPPVFKLFVMDIKTRHVSLLLDDATSPAVSPDGKKISYVKRGAGGKSSLNVYDMRTKDNQIIIGDTAKTSGGAWSPNGKELAFNMTVNKAINIYVVNLSSLKTRQLTAYSHHGSYTPEWSPGGDKITYYLEKGDRRDQVYVTDAAGSYQRNLTNDTTTHNFYPGWMGNDKIIYTVEPGKLAMINADGTGKIVIDGVNSFFARYNKKLRQIAFLTMPPLNLLEMYDINTKKVTALMDASQLLPHFKQ